MKNRSTSSEDLAKQLNHMLASQDAGAFESSEDPALRTAYRLTQAPKPALRPDAYARIQGLMLDAQLTRASSTPRVIRFPLAALARIAAVLAIFMIGISVGVQPVLANSLPGDVLYPVKRNLEVFALNFITNDTARVNTYMNYASNRLSEAQQILQEGRFQQDLVSDALNDLKRGVTLAKQTDILNTDPMLSVRIDQINRELDLTLNMIATRQVIPDSTLRQLTDTVQSARAEMALEPEPQILEGAEATASPAAQTDAPIISNTEAATAEPTQEQAGEPVTVTATATDIATDPAATASQPAESETTSQPAEDLLSSPQSSTGQVIFTQFINANQRVNVRSGPGTAFAVVTQLEPGTSVVIIGISENGNWTEIEYSAEGRGWIAEYLLATTLPPVQTDPGQGNSGQGNSGQGNSGQGNSGQGNSGQGNSGQGNSGQGNSGQGNSGQGNSGQGNSGQGNSGQGNSGQGNSGQGNSGQGRGNSN